MKLKLWQKIALPTLLVVSLGIGLGGSIAWFDMRTSLQPQSSFEGVSEGAYFAYGNGKPRGSGDDEPYGISLPRHLYNLAWLQYLGLIDDVFNQKPATSEAYFELANDIDMTGWTLPPIGTTTNPFMGHFNGNGYTITGLTISNQESDFSSGSSKKPERASSYSSDIPHIVGLFGVVGPYYGSGLAYSSATDAITDVKISGITVKSTVGDVLAGLVAGYVNGPISNVGVTDTDSSHKSTLNLSNGGSTNATPYTAGKNAAGTAFSKISEFGTVGYAESIQVKEAKKKTTTLQGYDKSTKPDLVVKDSGENIGWGGSIDMATTYEGLHEAWNDYNTSDTYLTGDSSTTADGTGVYVYPSSHSVTTLNGETTSDTYSGSTIYAPDSGCAYYTTNRKDAGQLTSQYTFYHKDNGNNFMYLYGENSIDASSSVNKTQVDYNDHEAPLVKISYTSGGNTFYLTRSGTTLGSSGSSGNAATWIYENNKLFGIDSSGDNSVYYYLYNDNGELKCSTSQGSASTFSYNSSISSYYITVSSVDRYLFFDASTSKWRFGQDYTGKTISYGSQDHCLSVASWSNGGDVEDSAAANATVWIMPANGSSGYVYAMRGGQSYYLYNNGGSLQVSTSAQTTWTVSSSGEALYSGNLYVQYDADRTDWVLKSNVSEEYYTIYNQSQSVYLNNNGTSGLAASPTTAAHWYFEENHGFYVLSGSTKYYLGYGSRVGIATGTQARHCYTLRNSSNAIVNPPLGETTGKMWNMWQGSTAYYLRYSSNSWGETTNQNSGDTFVVNHVNYTPSIETIELSEQSYSMDKSSSTSAGNSYQSKATTQTTEHYYIQTQPTFFPLKQETGESTHTYYRISSTYNGTTYYLRQNGMYYAAGVTTDINKASLYMYDGTGFYRGGYLCYSSSTIYHNSYNNSYLKMNGSNVYGGTNTYHYYNGTRWYTRNSSDSSTLKASAVSSFEVPNGVPSDTNTGYITAGTSSLQAGNIRVSRYAGPELGANASIKGVTYSAGIASIDDIYTINGSGVVDANSVSWGEDSPYSSSVSKLEDVFSTDPNGVYGLHFMDSQMLYGDDGAGNDQSIYADSVKINGQSYTNYELPQNCIDFNLKEKGYINFIAGTYFPNNNCFFTVSEVQRNSSTNKIIRLKNIRAVYTSNVEAYSNVYLYDDGTYSTPYKYSRGRKVTLDDQPYTEYSTVGTTCPSGYSLKFNFNWIDTYQSKIITDATYYQYPFYFEIPMNDGEYAMGAPHFSGGGTAASGAYLMYLDIGANAAKMNRTSITEYIREITNTFRLPKGICLIGGGVTAINDIDSFCVVIGTNYKGTVTLSRDSATAGTATFTDTTNKIMMGYYHEPITVLDGNGAAITEAAPVASTTTETRRITYYDYTTTSGALSKIIVTRQTIDGVEQTTTSERFSWDTVNQEWVTDGALILYDNDGRKVTDLEAVAINTTSLEPGTGTTVLKFISYDLGTGTVDITYGLEGEMQATGSGQFFVVSGYTINLTYTDAVTGAISDHVEIVSYVATYNTLSITFTLNDGTGATHTIVIPTP